MNLTHPDCDAVEFYSTRYDYLSPSFRLCAARLRKSKSCSIAAALALRNDAD